MESTTVSKRGEVSISIMSEERGDSDEDRDVSAFEDVNKTDESTNIDDDSNATNRLAIHESLQKVATQLATNVDFFRDHAPDIAQLQIFPYTKLPSYHKFCDGKGNDDDDKTARFELRKRLIRDVTHFPLMQKKGKLQVPMALLCETEDRPYGALVIVNYWRQLKACRQRELKTSMQRFYVRPNVTNERLNLVVSLPTKASIPSSASTSKSISFLCDKSEDPRQKQGGYRRRSRLPTSWGFRCLETCTQLAETLGLCPPGEDPKHACELLRTANLEFPRTRCKAEDCVYPSLARNNGYCCRHGLHFGPTPGRVNGRRGYMLLGDVYTRPYLVTTTAVGSNTNPPREKINNASITNIKKLSTCSCRNEACVGIGYSPTMIQFDIHRFPKDLRDAIWSNREALDMTTKTHFQTSRNKRNDGNDAEPSTRSSVLRLAPWHFHPEHREFLPDGSWKLLDHSRPPASSTNGNASEGNTPVSTPKEWKGLPLPTYSPKDFLEEPIMKEYAARKSIDASTSDMLPSWCREYVRLEEGPFSISEVQRNFLWDHTLKLEKELASRIVSFRTKERALETELRRLQDKYNEKKFLKRRDKKRKRNHKSNKTCNKNTSSSSGGGGGKPLPSSTLQDENTSNNKNQPKKKRSEPMDKAAHNPSGYLGVDERTNAGAETTSDCDRQDSSSAIEPTHRRNSHRMGPAHYTDHPHQQRNHRHHPYPHSYPQHPQHIPHPHLHDNRPATMDLRHHSPHYHHRPQQQAQEQPLEGLYPQHHQAYHHARHDERAEHYQEHPQDHTPEVLQQQQQEQQHQQQQQQQQQQHTHHYSEQQEWRIYR